MSHPRDFLPRLRVAGALALVVAAALTVSACGRRGPPEAPPSAAVLSTDDQGNVVEDRRQKAPERPFILDPLLD